MLHCARPERDGGSKLQAHSGTRTRQPAAFLRPKGKKSTRLCASFEPPRRLAGACQSVPARLIQVSHRSVLMTATPARTPAQLTNTASSAAHFKTLCYTARVPKGMEPKNSSTARYPHPSASGFFAPVITRLMAGRATDTRPARGRSPLGAVRVLSLPAALWATPKNVPTRLIQVSQRSALMTHATPARTPTFTDGGHHA